MNKWRVQPEQWNRLSEKHQRRIFKTGVRLSGGLIILLIMFSLMIESKLGY